MNKYHYSRIVSTLCQRFVFTPPQVILLFISLQHEKSGNMWNWLYKEKPGTCCNKILFFLYTFQPCIVGCSQWLYPSWRISHGICFLFNDRVGFVITSLSDNSPSWLKFSPFTRQIVMICINYSKTEQMNSNWLVPLWCFAFRFVQSH